MKLNLIFKKFFSFKFFFEAILISTYRYVPPVGYQQLHWRPYVVHVVGRCQGDDSPDPAHHLWSLWCHDRYSRAGHRVSNVEQSIAFQFRYVRYDSWKIVNTQLVPTANWKQSKKSQSCWLFQDSEMNLLGWLVTWSSSTAGLELTESGAFSSECCPSRYPAKRRSRAPKVCELKQNDWLFRGTNYNANTYDVYFYKNLPKIF